MIGGNAKDWGQHVLPWRFCRLEECAGCRRKVIVFSVIERHGGINRISASFSGDPGFVCQPEFILVASGSLWICAVLSLREIWSWLSTRNFVIVVISTTNVKIANGVLCNELDGLHRAIAFFTLLCACTLHAKMQFYLLRKKKVLSSLCNFRGTFQHAIALYAHVFTDFCPNKKKNGKYKLPQNQHGDRLIASVVMRFVWRQGA